MTTSTAETAVPRVWLAFDYTVMDAPADQGHGVFIFRNL